MMQTATTLQPRMKNPAAVPPGAWQAVEALHAATAKGGVPAATLNLVHLRASQINSCGSCVNAGSQGAKQAGETDERLFTVAAWREAVAARQRSTMAATFTSPRVTACSMKLLPRPTTTTETAS